MKIDDISFVIHDINKEMPLYTETKLSLPHSFSQGLPKNLKKESYKVDNKFLNRHLSTIEEIAHQFPNHDLPKWMQRYQLRYFKANLIGDGFFKNYIDEKGFSKNTRFRVGNTSSSFISLPKLGATLTGGLTGASTQVGANNLQCIKMTDLGVVGQSYNAVAFDSADTVGNVHWGFYDDSSGPTNLMGDTGGFASPNNFTFKTFSRISLTTTQTWSAVLSDNTPTIVENTAGAANKAFKSFTYGSLPNPTGGFSTTTLSNWHCKIGNA